MKNPLLYSLLVWLALLAIPTTRGQTLLDWKSATLQPLSRVNPAWAPRDVPYLPESSVFSYPATTPTPDPATPANVQANGLLVAPQFSSLARISNDRDVLAWCARSGRDDKDVASNMAALAARFPADANLLAWACSSQMVGLRLQTRQPGPLSSVSPNWSVQPPVPSYADYEVAQSQSADWEALAVQARRGQKLEPSNGFWWWLETVSLLGARRDPQVWSVLRAGSTKPTYDDHTRALVFALRRAHLETQGTVPVSFYLDSASNSTAAYAFYVCWREATRQTYENILGQQLQGHNQTALLGARDLMLMGKMLRSSNERTPKLVGIAVEAIVFRNTATSFAARLTGLPATTPVVPSARTARQGMPGSLLRYAVDSNQTSIAQQMTTEWNAVAKEKRLQTAASRALVTRSSGWITGVDNGVLALAGGFQNNGTLLVQTLPVPLLLLVLLWLLTALGSQNEPFALPTWNRGLGWSAFSLVALLAAQALFNHLVWDYAARYMSMTAPDELDFLLPRLAYQLPLWAFTFSACVLSVGALWSLMFAARRGRGDKSIIERFYLLTSDPDDRVGVVNLEPVMQTIGIAGAWGVLCATLALWFFQPARDALQNRSELSAHELYPGLSLALFCLVASAPALFYRTKQTGFRAYSTAYLHILRRFLVAHIALVTTLYLLFALGAAHWTPRFDAQWLQTNAPGVSSK